MVTMAEILTRDGKRIMMAEKMIGQEVETVESEYRKVENPLRDNLHTEVRCLDKPGGGGACHKYIVVNLHTGKTCMEINFQEGPLEGEKALAGGFQEDLLAIVRDRLQHFQAGNFACRENALALTSVEQAILWLNYRTAERERQGVLGLDKNH